LGDKEPGERVLKDFFSRRKKNRKKRKTARKRGQLVERLREQGNVLCATT